VREVPFLCPVPPTRNNDESDSFFFCECYLLGIKCPVMAGGVISIA